MSHASRSTAAPAPHLVGAVVGEPRDHRLAHPVPDGDRIVAAGVGVRGVEAEGVEERVVAVEGSCRVGSVTAVNPSPCGWVATREYSAGSGVGVGPSLPPLQPSRPTITTTLRTPDMDTLPLPGHGALPRRHRVVVDGVRGV
jgi:hypothetical protein